MLEGEAFVFPSTSCDASYHRLRRYRHKNRKHKHTHRLCVCVSQRLDEKSGNLLEERKEEEEEWE